MNRTTVKRYNIMDGNQMKKRIVSLLLAISVFMVMLPPISYAASENDLINKLKQTTSENIVKTYYEDFDSDGQNELFAFTGKIYPQDEFSPSMFLGDIWFVSGNDIYKINDSVTGGGFVMSGQYEPQILSCGDRLFLQANRMWGNGQILTRLYSVEGNSAEAVNFAGYLTKEDDNYIVYTSTYDCNIKKGDFDKGLYSGGGRSYKKYWCYYDEANNTFKEYSGTEITEDQFKLFDGAENILSLVNGKIYNILYRANGIININILKDTGTEYYELSNILVGYDDSSVWTIDDQHSDAPSDYRSLTYGGIYLANGCGCDADYPEFNSPNADNKADGKQDEETNTNQSHIGHRFQIERDCWPVLNNILWSVGVIRGIELKYIIKIIYMQTKHRLHTGTAIIWK